MTLNQVRKKYGAAPEIAKALGFTKACIYGWIKKRYVPYESQLIIELHCNGELKANRKHDPKKVGKL